MFRPVLSFVVKNANRNGPRYCQYAGSNHTRSESGYLDFNGKWENEMRYNFTDTMMVLNDFLSEDEEKSLFEEVHPYLKRLRYEYDHWDNAIHGYRETERLQWNNKNSVILQRVREIAFTPGTSPLSLIHVLDLAEDGVIKPHIDSTRFCGNTIAGLSLLSDSVMRLVHKDEKDKSVDVLLRRRSLYIMKNIARYDFTHEILGKECSKFKDENIIKDRRISIICRNEPEKFS